MSIAERKIYKRKRESARFILSLQLELMQRALAPWHRRATRLLEINCGEGAYLPFLWHSGFEITATEANADMRAQAQSLDLDTDIRAAGDEKLPFEDDFFDWAILHILPRKDIKLEDSMRECLRVTRRGLLFSFWNSASLPALCWRLSHRQAWPPNALAFPKVWSCARTLRIGNLNVMSTLCAPFFSWREKWFLRRLNSAFYFLPLGAWCLIRLDLGKPKLVTPMRLRLENIMTQAMPAMEYAERKEEAALTAKAKNN